MREAIAQSLEDVAHIIRGKEITICGFCYHDLHDTEQEHAEKTKVYHGNYGMAPLAIYEKDWSRDKTGRWHRND